MCHKDRACHHVLGFDDGGRDLGAWDVGNFQPLEKAKKWMDLPLRPPKRNVVLPTP